MIFVFNLQTNLIKNIQLWGSARQPEGGVLGKVSSDAHKDKAFRIFYSDGPRWLDAHLNIKFTNIFTFTNFLIRIFMLMDVTDE